VLVVQATAAWSRAQVETRPRRGRARCCGGGHRRRVGRGAGPSEPHAWRAARVVESTELAAPVVAAWPGGARVGLCGDAFDARGGVEGAWHAGRALTARLGALPSGPA
jgi:predicted NAD/FAD-dependent oxidoreductase